MSYKKFVAMALTLALSVSAFAGCSSNDKETTTTTAATTTEAAATTTKAAANNDETTTAAQGETTEAQGDASDTQGDAPDTGSSEPTWKQHASEKVKFDWYINFSWFTRKWGTDKTSQYITEKTGVDVEYIAPAGNEAEKMNTMIASDTLPSLITLGWYEGQVAQIVDGGMIYSLNELADQYDPYFYEVADSQKLGWYQRPDGKTYGYPNASYSPEAFEKYKSSLVSNQTFLVRKDIYEAIGSPDMSNPEGFLNALKAAKEQYPTVNGSPLIPIGFNEFHDGGNGTFENYIQNFLGIPFEKDGQLYDRLTDPEYISWLKVMRQANQDGLIAKDVFIDKRAQIEEKVAQGRYFSMIFQSQDLIAQNTELYVKGDNTHYISVDCPMNSNGTKPTLSGDGISGWTLTMITKNNQSPDRAIQFLSYLISEEGQHDIKLGAPGQWETVDGKDQLTAEMKELCDTDKDKYEIEMGGENTHWMLMDTAMQQQWTTDMSEPLKQTKEWTTPYVTYTALYDGLINFDSLDPDTPEEVNMTKIKAKWGTTLPKLIMAASDEDFDKLFQEFVDYRASTGFDEIVNVRNEKLKVNKSKLGM